jgi:hypothetical protein
MYYGQGARGIAALVCAVSILCACRNEEQRMHARWFWITISALAVVQVPIVFIVPWDVKNDMVFGVVLMMFIAADNIMIHGCIWLVGRQIAKRNRRLPDAPGQQSKSR